MGMNERRRRSLATIAASLIVLFSPVAYTFSNGSPIEEWHLYGISLDMYQLSHNSEVQLTVVAPVPMLLTHISGLFFLPNLFLIYGYVRYYLQEYGLRSLVIVSIIAAVFPYLHFLMPFAPFYPADFVIFLPLPSIFIFLLVPIRTKITGPWSDDENEIQA